MIIIIILIIIALTHAIQDFYNRSPHCAVNCFQTHAQVAIRNHVQITCNTSGTYHKQHIVCYVVQRDSSAIKFGRVEITFILAFFYWLNH